MDFKDRIAGKIVGAVGLRLSIHIRHSGWVGRRTGNDP